MKTREEILERAKRTNGALFAIEIAKLSLEVQLDIRDLLVQLLDASERSDSQP
jgi:hypothetical protein